MSFERKNLAYVVRHTEDKESELLHILQRVDGSGIVYTRNRKKTKEISQFLNRNHITATFIMPDSMMRPKIPDKKPG